MPKAGAKRSKVVRLIAPVVTLAAALISWFVGVVALTFEGQPPYRLGPVTIEPVALWLTLGSLLTVIAVGLPLLQQVRATRQAERAVAIAIEAETQRLGAIRTDLLPMATLLSRISDERRGARTMAALQGQAKSVALYALTRLLATDVSVGFLEVAVGPRRKLERKMTNVGGAAEQLVVVDEITDDDAFGREVFRLLDQGQAWLGTDFGSDEIGKMMPSSTTVGACLWVPVRTTGAQFGLITIDAASQHDISESDVPVAKLLARLLAAALNA